MEWNWNWNGMSVFSHFTSIYLPHLGDNEASHDCTPNQIQTVFLITNQPTFTFGIFLCIVFRELDLLFTFALILCDNKSARLNKMICQKEVLRKQEKRSEKSNINEKEEEDEEEKREE